MSFLPVVIAGEWYFVGVCSGCGKQRALGPAPRPEEHPLVRAWPHVLTCDCGATTDLEPAQIDRLQAEGAQGQTLGPNVVFRLPSRK
jgi:hypothetical protein